VVDNYDNICAMNESYLVKNLDDDVLVESDSLTNMPPLEDIILIVN